MVPEKNRGVQDAATGTITSAKASRSLFSAVLKWASCTSGFIFSPRRLVRERVVQVKPPDFCLADIADFCDEHVGNILCVPLYGFQVTREVHKLFRKESKQNRK